jgi:hypothetical protein
MAIRAVTDAWGKGLQPMVPVLFTNDGQKNFRAKVNHGRATHKVRSNPPQNAAKLPSNRQSSEELPRLAKCVWRREAVPISAAYQA